MRYIRNRIRLFLLAGMCIASAAAFSSAASQAPSKQPLRPEPQKPVEGSAEEVERYKTELAERVKGDRRGAKRGDVLTPELTSFLLKRFHGITQGKDGAKTLALIQESNPGELALEINGTYPKGAALATTPPVVLSSFPELPEGIEYRFVGCRLMLMAHDSRVVIDYTEECFW